MVKKTDIYKVKLGFINKQTGAIDPGQVRPSVVVRVKDGMVQFRSMTSRTDKFPSTHYGVHIPKDETNNLHRDSAILCTKDNTFYIKEKDVQDLEKIGNITPVQLLKTKELSAHCNRKDIQLKKSVQYGR